MSKTKRKQTKTLRAAYQLSLFEPAIAPAGLSACGCAELKPGLDASICSACGVAWRHPWNAEAAPKLVSNTAPAAAELLSIPQMAPEKQGGGPGKTTEPIAPRFCSALSPGEAWAIAELDSRIVGSSISAPMRPGEWIAIAAWQY